jgi:hypothetical protein
VLVGSNLVTALFCTLIYIKMAEKQLVKYVEARLGLMVCPKCHHENYEQKDYAMEIHINSPKSPYLAMGSKLKQSRKEDKDKLARFFIEDGGADKKSPALSPILTLKSKHKKAKEYINELNTLFEACCKKSNYSWIAEQI